ncbi:MAG: RHS repeat-associated core domain-containing protein [Dehalococcoidia bacterium]
MDIYPRTDVLILQRREATETVAGWNRRRRKHCRILDTPKIDGCYPDNKTVDYSYDPAGNLTSVTDWLSKVTEYTYDEVGRLTQTELPNDAKTTYTYDGAGWLDKLTNLDSATPANVVSSFDYTRDAVGNARWIKDKNGVNELYQYDNLYRLVEVIYRDSSEVDYTYDKVGNRKTMVAGRVTTSYTYDDADQLTSAGGVNYTYDNNGNLTGRGSDTFSYDHENRMISATVGGTTSSNVYNGDGLRTSQTVTPTTTNYIWDVNRGLPGIIQDGARSYVYGLQRISLTTTSGGRNYFFYDGLGSTSEVLNNAGTAIVPTDYHYQYDVFGGLRSTNPGTNYWRFTGEQSDSATGLHYLRARHYDPASGRFIERDPWRGSPMEPLTQTPYPYVVNNPTRFVDPSGLCGVLDPVDCAEDLGECIGNNLDCVTDPVEDGADSVVGVLADSYVDISYSIPLAPNVVLIIGVRISLSDGSVHPYTALGLGSKGTSVSIAPDQSISEGRFCAGQFGSRGLFAQVGAGQLDDKEGANPFGEIGIGPPGGGLSCGYIFPSVGGVY